MPETYEVHDARQRLSVVFADMVGYSAYTSKDEVGTHRMWMRFIQNVVVPTSDLCNGRIIRTLGDGILMSFDAAGDAIDWCLKTQTQVLAARTGKSKSYPGLSLRCAAHICDAIEDGGDIYGNGVNITKRLQDSIAPDGIIISEDLFKVASDVRTLKHRRLGFVKMKNIEDPICAYEILPETRSKSVGLAQVSRNLPSLAIMPLQSIGGGAEFQFFADGVVDDIITSLTSLKELIVIARSSTLSERLRGLDPADIGQVLNARYVVTGTLRRSTERIRISVALCDTQSGEIVFSEQSEFPHAELFETQDRIVQHIVSKIAPNVREAERVSALRKPPENFTAYELTLKALDHMSNLDRENYQQALGYLQRAIDLDPDFAMPVAYMVRWYCVYVGQGWSTDRARDVANAKQIATKAIRLDRYNALALASYGHLKSYLERDYDTALLFLDRSREVGPSLALAWMLSSATLSYMGRADEALDQARHGIRLSPNDQDLYQFYDFLAIAHYLNSDFEEAAHWSECSFAEKADYTSNWRVMILTNAAAGHLERAGEFADKVLTDTPNFSIEYYLKEICPFRQSKDRHMVAEHLRLAGIQ